METRSILMWVRLAAIAACLMLGAETVLPDTRPPHRPWAPPPWLGLMMHMAQAAIFFHTTRFFPPRRGYPRGWMVAQFLVSFGVDHNAWIMNTLAVALVIPRREHRPWLAGVTLGTVVNLTLLVSLQLSELPRDKWPVNGIAIAVGLALLEALAWLALVYLAGLLIVRMEGDRRRLTALNAELVSSRALLAETSRMAERLDIARELHDSLGHHLTTLNLELEIAQHAAPAERDAQVRKAQFLARLLLADLRDTVTSWRRELTGGLPEALRCMAREMPNVEIDLRLDEDLPELSPPRAHALLRCAQEGLTNALRHGGARRVAVVLRRDGAEVVLSISDEGGGCPNIVPGNGLTGIRTRAREQGGQAEFEAPAGGGFLVRVRVPVAEGAA